MAIKPKILFTAATAILLGLTAQADDANSAPAQQSVSQTAAVPAVVQGDPIARAAAAYGSYHTDVGELEEKGLNSVGDVDHALNTLAGQNASQLSRGWLAYAALVASQSPELRTSLREVVAAYGRDGLAGGIAVDAGYVRRVLDGGDEAVALALVATSADSQKLSRSAEYFREQAYALQGQSWAKTKLRSPQMRSKVDSLISSSRVERAPRVTIVTAFQSPEIDGALQRAGNTGAPSLWDGVITAATGVQFPSLRSPSLTSNRSSLRRGHEHTADKIASLAAYRIMGVGTDNAPQVQTVLGEGPMRSCVTTAQLNINQCVAANSFPFETVDCIGKHAISEVSECFGEASN